MEKTGLFYARFMDDWVVLAPTRWELRRAIRIVNETLAKLRVEQHPDKTFIGRIERGFSFLGYQINKAGLVGVAPPTTKRFVERVRRLYEQGADLCRIGDYVRRWLIWVRSGVASRDVRLAAGWMHRLTYKLLGLACPSAREAHSGKSQANPQYEAGRLWYDVPRNNPNRQVIEIGIGKDSRCRVGNVDTHRDCVNG